MIKYLVSLYSIISLDINITFSHVQYWSIIYLVDKEKVLFAVILDFLSIHFNLSTADNKSFIFFILDHDGNFHQLHIYITTHK